MTIESSSLIFEGNMSVGVRLSGQVTRNFKSGISDEEAPNCALHSVWKPIIVLYLPTCLLCRMVGLIDMVTIRNKVRYIFSLYNLLIWGADYNHTLAYDHHLGMRQLKLLAVRCLIRMTQHDSSRLQSPPIQSISWADEFNSRSTTPFFMF